MESITRSAGWIFILTDSNQWIANKIYRSMAQGYKHDFSLYCNDYNLKKGIRKCHTMNY